MEFVKFPKIPRLNRDMIITEKIDGSNAQVYITPINTKGNMLEDFAKKGWYTFTDGDSGLYQYGIVPCSRNKTVTLKKDNFGFAKWVFDNGAELLKLGPGRHFGEWWGKGIQRGYGLGHRRFSLFNVAMWNENTKPDCCSVVPILYQGPFSTETINSVVEKLSSASVAAPGFWNPEGVVVFHTAASQTFKVTCENDEVPKGLVTH